MTLHRPPGSRRVRVAGAVVAGATLLAGSAVLAVASPASAAAGCRVNYTANSWNTGFTANVVITNLGDPLNGWTLEWDWAGNQRITSAWNGVATQTGTRVTLRNAAWNGSLPTNGSVNPGFQATYSGTNTAPTSFTLNGVSCTGTPVPTTPPTSAPPTSAPPTSAPPTSAPPTSAPPTSAPPTSAPPTSVPPTSVPPGQRAENPFVGKGYVNPNWKANVESVPGGSRISNYPTAVWLDRIAAIAGTPNVKMGLREHLDAAVAQGATYATFVIYNLPGRDCSALASNGELGPTEIDRYKTEYIDVIAEIQGDPKYRGLRIINIVEIDSLPNLLTNAGTQAGATEKCRIMKANGNYEKGIAYALSKFHAIPNVYNYVDAAHHGWLGWSSNFGPAAELFTSVVRSATGGLATVDGFIVNTSNYSATVEPYFSAATSVGGNTVRQSKWLDWNDYADEQSFAQAFRQKLVSLGFSPGIGMLIDTSRNGWGGPNRPTGPSTSTNVDTFVNESRIDRRIHAGNWCNQSGAGIGERPRANPAPGIDAYVWVKPPGESDGSSALIPNNEGKGFDRMCDPTYGGNALNGNNPTGALPNAPIAGAFFPAQLEELMRNAYPAL